VESKKIKTLITKLGVDYAQGHAIGKPSRLAVVLKELTTKKKSSTG
jgi:EAL domain-containing protein (putative c-di-GMP-specific phosphodiesterase class I)